MSRRSRSREVALQVLFQDDLNPCDPPMDATPFLKRRLGNSSELFDFSVALVDGVRLYHAKLDGILESLAEHWSVARMATADRNILRLGVFEMLILKTPHRVAIDEAIELAKRFGGAQSSQFINGVLDRVWHEKKSAISVNSDAKEEDSTEQINNPL